MTKVLLLPNADNIESNNGIGRVVHAQRKYLPQFGIDLVGSEDRADIIAGHTHDYGASRVDVVHLHGVYWLGDVGSGEYSQWHKDANRRIIASVRRARAVTVPSDWVAQPFRRDMRIRPLVIGHGLDMSEWSPGYPRGYILWNKNRDGDVCNPTWPYHLALRGQDVVTTFIPKGESASPQLKLRVTGAMASEPMKALLREADIYLATTKETFGIGTLEALACGVPVLGFDWGGTAGLITHGENGYLARPGDIDDLLEGAAYIRANRARLSDNAIQAAQAYTWERAAEQYANLYHSLARNVEPQTVAVIVTTYNYGPYLRECLDSVLRQTYPVDEVVVVDDGSTDDSAAIAAEYAPRGVRLIRQDNQGVAAARNNGIAATSAPYVICLDADDLLDPRYVEVCRNEMRKDRGVGIVWTNLNVLHPNGSVDINRWPGPFDWEFQATASNPPHTTIHTGAMWRREMWRRAGGYKQEHAPGEDAEFYTRGLSVGFTAVKATDLPLFVYRDHGRGAHRVKHYKAVDTWHPWMRDHDYPLGAPSEAAPYVRSYSDPKVTVIIPVGPGHGQYLPDALESLVGQTMRDWEVVVVDDGGLLPSLIDPFPFPRHYSTKRPASGPGAARNVGLVHAKAPLVLFLDADDKLDPTALAQMCAAYADAGGRYVYGDWQYWGEDDIQRSADYNAEWWLDFTRSDGRHPVTVLMATTDAQALKFDETLPVLEDLDFFARSALAGKWGQRIEAVTLLVRNNANGLTAQALSRHGDIPAMLAERYKGKSMASCCGGNGGAILAAKAAMSGVMPEREIGLSIRRTTKGRGSVPEVSAVSHLVRMEFTGKRSGAVTFRGLNGREYRGANSSAFRFANVHPDDANKLESTGQWRSVGANMADLAPANLPLYDPPQTPPTPLTPPQAEPVSVSQPVPAPTPGIQASPAAVETVQAVSTLTAPMTQAIASADGVVVRKRGRPPSKNTPLNDREPQG